MLEINEVNFAEEVKDGVVMVDFYTTRCGPCRALAPVLESLENAKVLKVNVDENMDLAVTHGVSAVPTLVFFKNGEEKTRLVGLQSKETLQGEIDALNG